ncbi:MAG: peptidylprolyl isomerase [Clostridia bacterium]|nr:peptidylprolyl isomerase [Clostridia bacterium]
MRKRNKLFFAAVLFCAICFLLMSCQNKEAAPSEPVVKTALPSSGELNRSATTDNSYVAVNYCDCNVLGVIMENKGVTTSCSTHFSAEVPADTYAAFDETARLYAALAPKIETDATNAYKKVVPTEGDDIYGAYQELFAQIKKTYALSAFSSNQKTTFPTTGGVIVGVNKKFLMTGSDKFSRTDVLLIASRIFGYKSTDTFQTYGHNLVAAYGSQEKVTDEARLSLDGGIYTTSGTYVFPYIVKTTRTSTFPVCLFMTKEGVLSAWIGDETVAAEAVDFSKRLTAATSVEVYGRCDLFETSSGFYRFSFAEGAKDVEGTYAKIKLSTTDGLSKELTFYLLPEYAPETVANFIKYAESGFYNGTSIHRIMPGIGVQGGSYIQTGGSQNYGYATKANSEKAIKGEFATNGYPQNVIGHCAGVISMARTDDNNSATSGFFICSSDHSAWDGLYAAFGFMPYQEDIDFVDTLANKTATQEVTLSGTKMYYPASRLITIEEVTIIGAKTVE